MAPLPVEALRLDPATTAGLRRVGLRRIGELYPMPRDALARRFGEAVARRLDQALGQLPEPLSPAGEAPVRRVRLSFAEPIADPADLARAIERLAEDLVARLAREGMGARRLDLAFHRVDGRVEHIRIGTARPSRDPAHLGKLLQSKLETVDPGLGVEDMILAVFAVEPLPAEQADFVGGPGANGIAPLLDRLGARFGLAALSHIEARESHIPERASVYVPISVAAWMATNLTRHPSPRPRGREPKSTGLEGPSPIMGGRAGAESIVTPPRPVRLFLPPEPIEAVWLVPDDPPVHFTWRHRPYRVHRADGPERIAEEWWTDDGVISANAIRDYYRVEDEAGRRFWLFRAGLPGLTRRRAGLCTACLPEPVSQEQQMPELPPKAFSKSRTIGTGSPGPLGKVRERVPGGGVIAGLQSGPGYAELQVTSNFSFLRGASHPDELVTTAAALGHRAIAITDRNSVAGIVRAHQAAETVGIRLVVGVRLDLRDGTSLLAYPQDRAAYGRLTRLLTLGKRRAPKGECHLDYADVVAHGEGQILIVLPLEEGRTLPQNAGRGRGTARAKRMGEASPRRVATDFAGCALPRRAGITFIAATMPPASPALSQRSPTETGRCRSSPSTMCSTTSPNGARCRMC